MVQISYYDSALFTELQAALATKYQELLEGLAVGADYETYLRLIGQLNGLKIAMALAKEAENKIRSDR